MGAVSKTQIKQKLGCEKYFLQRHILRTAGDALIMNKLQAIAAGTTDAGTTTQNETRLL
jgi:hypothetical protein